MNCRKQNIVDPLKWETTILPIRWAGSWDKGFPTVYPGMTVQGHTSALGSRLVQLKAYACAYYSCRQECVSGCGVCCTYISAYIHSLLPSTASLVRPVSCQSYPKCAQRNDCKHTVPFANDSVQTCMLLYTALQMLYVHTPYHTQVLLP